MKNYYIRLASLVFIGLLASGCASLFAIKTEVNLVPSSQEIQVEILDFEEGFQPKTLADLRELKVKNRHRMLVVKEVRPGYMTRVEVIEPEGKNWYRAYDGLHTLGAMGYWYYAGLNSDDLKISQELAAVISLSSIPTMVGNLSPQNGYKIFTGTQHLPSMRVHPQLSENGNKIRLDQVNIGLAKTALKASFYSSYKAYKKGRSGKDIFSEEDVYIEETIFQDELRFRLAKTGYIDTTAKIFSVRHVDLELDAKLVAVDIQIMDEIMRITGEVEWVLSDAYTGETKVQFTQEAQSNWAWHHNDTNRIEGCLRESLTSLFELSMADFLIQPLTQKELMRKESSFNPIYESWQPIAVESEVPKLPYENTIDQSMDAVAMLAYGNREGSGFFITGDGKMISSYRFLSEAVKEKGSVEVVLKDGRVSKAKILRANPIYDLVLLQVEEKPNSFIQLHKREFAAQGTSIYAIGNQGREIGMGLNQGIISGIREDEGRTVLQTDASLNAGNAGGLLIDEQGELIGIIQSKLVGPGVEGIGFAIPATYIEEGLKVYFL